MKKHETLSKKEQLLLRVLDECLEEDLSFIPPEREIARKHRFSEKFETTIEELLENTSSETRKKEIKKHFSPRYGQWAACILIFCLCSGLFYYVMGPASNKSVSMADETAMQTEGTEEVMEEALEEEAEAFPEEAAAAEDAQAAEGAAKSETQKESGKVYCGQTVYPAKRQEVAETLESVTTLVNCPVLDEENPVLILTIGNTGDEDIRYLNHHVLEVWLDDGWYVVPSRSEKQEEWLTLEAGMAVDEEIDLTDYQIDYDASQYRLITRVGQEAVSAEFTFEEAFTETMEELEEEESSRE